MFSTGKLQVNVRDDIFNQHTGAVFQFPDTTLEKHEADAAEVSHKPFGEVEAVWEHRGRFKEEL